MKFLVLALCVCAASAASFGSLGQQGFNPFQSQLNARVQTVTAVVPVAYAAGKAVYEAPVDAANRAYGASKDTKASILRFDSEVNHDSFNYVYETDNGIAAQASGATKKVGNEDVLVIQGSYKYIDEEGKEVLVTYVADENGFQPQSNILPVGPAIPEDIARSIEYNRAHYKPENN